MPLAQLRRVQQTLARVQAQRDLIAIRIAAWPHYVGTQHDPRAGDRARDAITDAFTQVAFPEDAGRDPTGRRFRWDKDTKSSDLRAWFLQAGAKVG